VLIEIRPLCVIMFRHIRLDPETLRYLDYASDRACSAGQDPVSVVTPVGAVTTVLTVTSVHALVPMHAVTTAPVMYAMTTVDTITTMSSVAIHVHYFPQINITNLVK
jgi:hypothetical protein